MKDFNDRQIRRIRHWGKIANFEHEEYGLIESMVDQKYVTQQVYEEYISMNPDIEKEVRQLMNEINDFTIGLDNYLKKLSLEGIEEKYPLNEYELIISFNYTNLIENVYECKDIEHIHGLLNQKMIIGFNGYLNRTIEEDRNPKEEEFKYDGGDPSEFLIEKHTYSRSSEHYWQIEMEDLIHENLVKEIKKLSDENDKSLFEKRNEIEKIVENKLEENQYQIDIIGHSLGDPDKDFFDLLNDKIKYNGGIIQCYFHSQISKKELEDKIKKIIGNFN